MKITIDTKEDSHEDIRKVMQILHHFVDPGRTTYSAQATEPVNSSNMMSMFSEDKPTASEPVEETAAPMSMFTSTTKKAEESAPNFNSFLNLADKKEEEDKEDPQIEFF
jgi:hypothetical protein